MDRLTLRTWGRTLELRTLPRSLVLAGGIAPEALIEVLFERLGWVESVLDSARVSALEVRSEPIGFAEILAAVLAQLSGEAEGVTFGESAVALSSVQEYQGDAIALGESASDSATHASGTSDATSELVPVAEASTSSLSAAFEAQAETIALAESAAYSLTLATATSDALVELLSLDEAVSDGLATVDAEQEPVALIEASDDSSHSVNRTNDALSETLAVGESLYPDEPAFAALLPANVPGMYLRWTADQTRFENCSASDVFDMLNSEGKYDLGP